MIQTEPRKTVTTLQKKNLNSPDETRNFDKGKMQITSIGDVTCGRFVLEPGWLWSKPVKPVVKTDNCQQHHPVYKFSGRTGLRMDDGSDAEADQGDFALIPTGHDAWVVGSEPCVGIGFTGVKTYAKYVQQIGRVGVISPSSLSTKCGCIRSQF